MKSLTYGEEKRGDKRMWLRLRQIAGVAENLRSVESDIQEILGVAVCFRDSGVGYFGLENALFPIGNQLLEIVSPIEENTAGGRYIRRRGGDSGYMVITQCDDHSLRRARIDKLGIRTVLDNKTSDFINLQMHPRDTGGTFFEIDQQLGAGALLRDGPWHPAGPNWQRAKRLDRVLGILAAEIQCDDPALVAHRWAEIAQLQIDQSDEVYELALENALVRFVPCTDGRPEGLGGIDLETRNRAIILDEAEKRGKISGDNQISICGIRMNLI